MSQEIVTMLEIIHDGKVSNLGNSLIQIQAFCFEKKKNIY